MESATCSIVLQFWKVVGAMWEEKEELVVGLGLLQRRVSWGEPDGHMLVAF